jgi:hypothetical protein
MGAAAEMVPVEGRQGAASGQRWTQYALCLETMRSLCRNGWIVRSARIRRPKRAPEGKRSARPSGGQASHSHHRRCFLRTCRARKQGSGPVPVDREWCDPSSRHSLSKRCARRGGSRYRLPSQHRRTQLLATVSLGVPRPTGKSHNTTTRGVQSREGCRPVQAAATRGWMASTTAGTGARAQA